MIEVKGVNEICSSTSPFNVLSASNLVAISSMLPSKSSISIDWNLIVFLLVGSLVAFGSVLLGIQFLSNFVNLESLTNSRPDLPRKLSKKGGAITTSQSQDLVAEVESQELLDLDGFDLELFLKKLETHKGSMETLLGGFQDKTVKKIGMIVKKNEAIRQLILKREDSLLVGLVNFVLFQNTMNSLLESFNKDPPKILDSFKQELKRIQEKEIKVENKSLSLVLNKFLTMGMFPENEKKTFEATLDKERKLVDLLAKQLETYPTKFDSIATKMMTKGASSVLIVPPKLVDDASSSYSSSEPIAIQDPIQIELKCLVDLICSETDKKVADLNELRQKINTNLSEVFQPKSLYSFLNAIITNILDNIFTNLNLIKQDTMESNK